MAEYRVEVPEHRYSASCTEPVARVEAGGGYEYEPADLTASECRDFAALLIATAERLEAATVGLDRMTNYSSLRHCTPFEPYALKVAKGTATPYDHQIANMQRILNYQSWADGTANPAGWVQVNETTQWKVYR